MKNYSFLLFLFTACVLHAQFGTGMGNQRQRQLSQPRQPTIKPNFEVEKYLGIVVYDIEKAAKKSSLKLDSKEGKQFSSILKNYNKKVKEIRRINSFTLRSTKEMVENFQKKAIKGDVSDQFKVQKKMAEDLKPISETIKNEDKELDNQIKKILSEKQYKRWIKYNKKMNKFFNQKEN